MALLPSVTSHITPPEFTDRTGLVPIESVAGRWLAHRWVPDAGLGHTRCGRYSADRMPDPDKDLPRHAITMMECGACVRADETSKDRP